ncbi:MAG: hypothetical protein ACOY94_19535 [Bacillota bacterium]
MGNPIFAAAEAHLISMLMGGEGWKITDMTHVNSGWSTVASHDTYTHLNISGQGFLVGMYNAENNVPWTVQIDGGTLYKSYVIASAGLFIVPFQTSLVVSGMYAPSGGYCAFALVGDYGSKWSGLTLVSSVPTNQYEHYANTVVDVAGAGLLGGLFRSNSPTTNTWVNIEVDNSGVRRALTFPNGTHVGLPFIPFTTHLKITCDYSSTILLPIYKLD